MRIAITFGFLASWAAFAGNAAVTIDRIAVIVGNHVILTSDIDRDIRLTAFLNGQKVESGPQAKRQAAERLIDQEVIRQEIITGGFSRPPESAGEELEARLVHDRFGGSQTAFRQALARYGITAGQLRAHLLWQSTVLQFINQRFRPGAVVSDDQAQQFYQQHRGELEKQNPGASQETLEAKARESLEGEQINQNFVMWLDGARKRARIEYKQEAFT